MTRLLMAIGIILALVATSNAEPATELHPGSRCFRVAEDGAKLGAVTIKIPSLIVAGADAAESNQEHLRLGMCLDDLASCHANAKPPSKTWAAVKWMTYGAGLALAFVAGAVLL